MPRKYGQDPIVEAICEFWFNPSAPWDLTVPGLIYERVKDSFPIRQRCQIANQSIKLRPQGPEQQIAVVDRMQFWNEERNAVIQTNENFLCVNHQRPYPTWTRFRPMVKRGLKAYVDAAGPRSISRISLHYINRIAFPKSGFSLKGYLNFYPETAEAMPKEFTTFMVGVTTPVPGVAGETKIQVTSARSGQDSNSVILDLDHRWVDKAGIEIDKALAWADAAHEHLVQLFESCLTDKTRGLFGKPSEENAEPSAVR